MPEQRRSSRPCPKCQAKVQRIHRTRIDHIINFVRPVKRFKCEQCGWQGRLRATAHRAAPRSGP